MIGPRTETLAEPVIGYRNWRLIEGELRSNFLHDQVWTEPVMHAACVRGYQHMALVHLPHRAPGKGCSCGLYAWHKPTTTTATFSWTERALIVGGAVVAWGKVQVHGKGFRAEHMRVLALADLAHPLTTDPARGRELKALGARFGVPVVESERLSEYAEEFGRVVPVGERPAA